MAVPCSAATLRKQSTQRVWICLPGKSTLETGCGKLPPLEPAGWAAATTLELQAIEMLGGCERTPNPIRWLAWQRLSLNCRPGLSTSR